MTTVLNYNLFFLVSLLTSCLLFILNLTISFDFLDAKYSMNLFKESCVFIFMTIFW